MKKKILFVIPSLDAGGAEKALVNLLNILPNSKYSIDLLLFKKQGAFIEQVPKHVEILSPGGDYSIFTKSLGKAIKELFLKRKWVLLLNRLIYTFTLKKYSEASIAEQKAWKYWKKAFPKNEKHYDIAVAFVEKSSIYYVVDKVVAPKKIGWIHTFYSKSEMSASFDKDYFEKLNQLVTITEECKQDLIQNFEHFTHISVIQNITSESLIHQWAEEPISRHDGKPLILTVGRLSKEKGYDLALDAFKILKNKGVEFHYYIIGEGPERIAIEDKIKMHQLEDRVTLLGLRKNPYPYIKEAMIYLQTSRYEGKSIAIDEAKILRKPILVTNFTTVKDQITDQVNGIITDMNPEFIAHNLMRLLQDGELRNRLVENLQQEELGTESEINKLYQLFNSDDHG